MKADHITAPPKLAVQCSASIPIPIGIGGSQFNASIKIAIGTPNLLPANWRATLANSLIQRKLQLRVSMSL